MLEYQLVIKLVMVIMLMNQVQVMKARHVMLVTRMRKLQVLKVTVRTFIKHLQLSEGHHLLEVRQLAMSAESIMESFQSTSTSDFLSHTFLKFRNSVRKLFITEAHSLTLQYINSALLVKYQLMKISF